MFRVAARNCVNRPIMLGNGHWKRRGFVGVHRRVSERSGWCPHQCMQCGGYGGHDGNDPTLQILRNRNTRPVVDENTRGGSDEHGKLTEEIVIK